MQDVEKKHTNQQIRYVVAMLAEKDIIKDVGTSSRELYILTDKGWLYETYDQLLTDEERMRKLHEEQITSVIATNKKVQETNASVLETNRKTVQNFIIARNVSIIAVIATLTSAFVSLITLVRSCEPKRQQQGTQSQPKVQQSQNKNTTQIKTGSFQVKEAAVDSLK